jgi:hypothetical protein
MKLSAVPKSLLISGIVIAGIINLLMFSTVVVGVTAGNGDPSPTPTPVQNKPSPPPSRTSTPSPDHLRADAH